MKKHPLDIIRAVEKEDLPEINSWYRARNEPIMPADLMPPNGFIVPGVAAGFFIRTTTSLLLIEGFISNPEASKPDRDISLDKICSLCVAAGRQSGAVGMLAITSSPVMKEYATKFNFKHMPDLEVFIRRN